MNLQRTQRPLLRALRKRRMEQLGLRSVEEVAALSKVTRNTIYNWEKGHSPALEELDRVAAALRVPLSWMVDAWSGRARHEEAPRPEWAEGLMREADAAYRLLKLTALASGVSPELVEEIEAGRRDALEQSPSGRLPSAPRRRASPGPRDG